VREVFRKARQAAPCIVFFDEIDALIPVRSAGGSDSHVAERVLSQFLAEMDGIEELKGVLVLGATNRIDMLDSAALRPGRFDEMVEILLPNEIDRHEIFAIHLRKKPLAKGIRIADLATKSDEYSGADIAGVCHKAAMTALRRVIQAGSGEEDGDAVTLEITMADLLASMDAEMGIIDKTAL
jgi:transitional endoplasmic reticulum ATPase